MPPHDPSGLSECEWQVGYVIGVGIIDRVLIAMNASDTTKINLDTINKLVI
jgi:hypothetical protein